MKFKEYITEKTDVDKAWDAFEKEAKKELGKEWNGKVTGDMIFGDRLSKKSKALYDKYFKLIGGKEK